MDAESRSNFLEAEEPTANQSEGAGVLDTAKGKAAIFGTQTGNVGLLWANGFRIGAGAATTLPKVLLRIPSSSSSQGPVSKLARRRWFTQDLEKV